MNRLALFLRFSGFLISLIVFSSIWPWLSGPFGSMFRLVAATFFGRNNSHEIVKFEQAESFHAPFDQRILLANVVQDPRHGLYLEFDSHQVGWTPLTFLAALILSSPVSWRRKACAMVIGEATVFAYEMVCVWIYISAHRNEIGVASYGGSLQTIFTTLETTLVEQVGASFIFPFLVWALVTVQLGDAARFLSNISPPSRNVCST